MSGTSLKTPFTLSFCLVICANLLAHNGKLGYAFPVAKIVVDGNFSDWPQHFVKYNINSPLSDNKPSGTSDFSAYFQLGYNLDNRSLYIAFTITDQDFIEDTSNNVQWNSQDGLELCLDARHIAGKSGVASFMYSKKLRNTNNAQHDPFAKNASWNIMEVAVTRKGNQRFVEWRLQLGDELAVGKSIGLDFQFFDRDSDGTFTFTGWGKGGRKINNPNNLGDVIPLAANDKLAFVAGTVAWDNKVGAALPNNVRIISHQNQRLWLQTELDSNGYYFAEVPPGQYQIILPSDYIINGDDVYSTKQKVPVTVLAKLGEKVTAARLSISGTPVPDLIPSKGVLLDYSSKTNAQVDSFIESYRRIYSIPGVSLALIKDGKLVYHKTYGLRNAVTGEKVDDNTLFEAASITKPVFAFAVQRLAERGVIDLDKPLYLYLPYKDIEYDDRYKLITAKHVLTHRTGFPNWRSMNADGKLNIRFTPGTDYNYSGEGFEYLKMVVEKITNKKVEQVLKEEVIDPIGLYHTFFSANDSLRRVVAEGHYDMMPSYKGLPSNPGMAYSMFTEAIIFTRFALYLLEQKGLNAQTYQTMLTKQSDYHFEGFEKPKFPVYMGMSLEIRESPFGKSFGHGGNNGDFKCKFEMYKDLKMGYVIFTNSNTSDHLLEAIRQFLVEGK